MRSSNPEDFETVADQGPKRPPTTFGDASPANAAHIVRAEPPRPPALPPAIRERQVERLKYRRGREALERRSMFRGLILLALLALMTGLLHGGWSRAFPPGWWRQW